MYIETTVIKTQMVGGYVVVDQVNPEPKSAPEQAIFSEVYFIKRYKLIRIFVTFLITILR